MEHRSAAIQCQADFVISQCLCILSESRGWTGLLDHTDGALWKASHSYKISVSDLYYCDGSCARKMEAGLPGMEMEETRQKRLDLLETDMVPEETTTVSREKNWSPRWMRNLCRICWRAPIRWKRLKCMRFFM